jgi:adenine-specific DNA-methyltransferase
MTGVPINAVALERSPDAAARARYGVFYTPGPVASALADWAVRADSIRVLDPSFGDGAFLEAAFARLAALRVRRPGTRLFGVEVDSTGAERIAGRRLRIPASNLLHADFFETELDHFGAVPFDAIIGNPPYVRHHLLDAQVRKRARERARSSGIDLNERSDAWAYFCAHLMQFLAPTGRLALLLPQSVLQAEYALPLLHAFAEGHGHTRLVRVQRHLFPEVSERTVVLLIDRARAGAGEVEYRETEDLASLRELLLEKARRSRLPLQVRADGALATQSRFKSRLRWQLTSEESQVWDELVSAPEVVQLDSVADIRIGVVTGANSWFIRSEQEARSLGKAVRGHAIVARAAWLRAAWWGHVEAAEVNEKRSQLLLIDPASRFNRSLSASIADGERQGLHTRSHCARRSHWYCLQDHTAPDLFLPYMGATAQRLIPNLVAATCTNAIHRVYLRPGAPTAAALAAGSWTSFSRLAAELFGRSYGGGVLKLEPSEAALLRIPIAPGAGENLTMIARALERDGKEAARAAADDRVLRLGLGLDVERISCLRSAAERLQRRRGH